MSLLPGSEVHAERGRYRERSAFTLIRVKIAFFEKHKNMCCSGALFSIP